MTSNNHSSNDLPVPYERNKYIRANIVNFIICYFDDEHQNKKSTFPNAFSDKKTPTHAHTNTQTKNPTKTERVTLFCFYKPHVEMTEFP